MIGLGTPQQHAKCEVASFTLAEILKGSRQILGSFPSTRPHPLLSINVILRWALANPSHESKARRLYDFLLVINWHLSSISYRSRDIESRSRSKTTPPQFEPPGRGEHLRISSSNLAGKEIGHWATFESKLHYPNFSRFVTLHSRYNKRQTDKHLMTKSGTCNATSQFPRIKLICSSIEVPKSSAEIKC